eukprot:2758266-Pyramimonas_sp.AAC.1
MSHPRDLRSEQDDDNVTPAGPTERAGTYGASGVMIMSHPRDLRSERGDDNVTPAGPTERAG